MERGRPKLSDTYRGTGEPGPGWPQIALTDRRHRHHDVLLWALRGHTDVVRDGAAYTIGRGQATVIPAGSVHSILVPPDAIVLPLVVPSTNAGRRPAPGAVVTLGEEWDDWFLHEFAACVSPIRAAGDDPTHVIATVARAGESAGDALALPRTASARTVARGLQTEPACPLTAEQWAARAGVSVRTLRRLFLAETGMTFSAWRTACRVQAASAALLAGTPVQTVATQLGFATSTGFIRAFTRHQGATPDSWRRAELGSGAAGADGTAGTPGGKQPPLQAPSPALAPPMTSAVATTRHHAHHHVLVWAYRGTVRARVGGVDHEVEQDHALWMPSTVEHSVHTDPGAVALPLSFSDDEIPADLFPSAPFAVPGFRRDALLRHVIACCTAVRPEGYRGADAVRTVLGPLGDTAGVRVPHEPGAARVARAILRNPADRRETRAWADEAGMDTRALDRAFRDETGTGLRTWRTQVRMLTAREMVAGGMAPSVVARRVGYRHLSGFSRDFSRHCGMPPRAFRAQDRTADADRAQGPSTGTAPSPRAGTGAGQPDGSIGRPGRVRHT
jgi:AraC-like DNA-binding protein/mannose-6-phosphate isomerase-like protein (cupin superfamily)